MRRSSQGETRQQQAMPDVRQYAAEMQEMLRRRDPRVYRAFIRTWRDLHQRGAAERLMAMDDAALRLRMEHMILSTPSLADLHESARAYVAGHEGDARGEGPFAPLKGRLRTKGEDG